MAEIPTLTPDRAPRVAPAAAPAAAAAGPTDAPIRIATERLTAMYHKFTAVKDVTLDFAANRVHALIGPSGCGKSTFLRTLNRMHELTEGGWITGRVRLDGHDIYAPAVSAMQVRRKIGMVFQKPTPFPTMSIYDNVAAGLRVGTAAGRPRGAALDEVVERALRDAALWDEVKDRLHGSAGALSGGQQQRLCIARTIAPRPEVVLLDEPTSALDPIATQKIEELLFTLKLDYTIVIVTHSMQQAARVSDTTTFFYLGAMIETGPTREIFTAPRHERTEAYITGRFG
ncbi:MAG TPA: phosphate ABC transporter ATP-binding protein PstB [Gemmatimonadales bacterium]|nr:phosphate ABC transporter ATP-binding protein PstB [Gemmatimonadales bacterium]